MVTLDEFLEHVAISGLIRAARLEQARAQLEPGGAEDAWLRLAKRLIGQGLLTSYQGRKLLAGATRGFFLGGYRILRPWQKIRPAYSRSATWATLNRRTLRATVLFHLRFQPRYVPMPSPPHALPFSLATAAGSCPFRYSSWDWA